MKASHGKDWHARKKEDQEKDVVQMPNGGGGAVEKEERAQNELNISETSNRISRRMGHAIWQLGDFGDSNMMALLRHDSGLSGLQMNGSREV